MTKEFVDLLNALALALAKFSEPTSVGARTWDGATYAPAPASMFDPYASKWWSIFTTLSGVLAGQDALSDRQKAYLDRLLFGGMGSFNDFVLDEKLFGSYARQTNHELNDLRRKLLEEFRRI